MGRGAPVNGHPAAPGLQSADPFVLSQSEGAGVDEATHQNRSLCISGDQPTSCLILNSIGSVYIILGCFGNSVSINRALSSFDA